MRAARAGHHGARRFSGPCDDGTRTRAPANGTTFGRDLSGCHRRRCRACSASCARLTTNAPKSPVHGQRLQRAEQPLRAPRGRPQLDEPVRQRLTAVPALELLGGDRAPQLVDDGAAIARDLVDVEVEMGRPQP